MAVVRELASALNDPASPERALHLFAIPQAIRERTPSEQAEFIRKASQDEVSDGGISVLLRDGKFGILKAIFPQQAEAWATQAGVQVDNCVAFKLEQNGVRAEVVLVCESGSAGLPAFRIVRLNNVKQLAESKLIIAEQRP
jgi:hypothetical protein